MKHAGRPALIAFASAFLFSATAGVAVATQVTSGNADLGIRAGYHWYDRSYIDDSSRTAATITWVSSGSVPTSWMGTEAISYKDSGAMCKTTGMQYNTSGPVHDLGRGTSPSCGSGYYFSKGISTTRNGQAYSYFYSPSSPVLYIQ